MKERHPHVRWPGRAGPAVCSLACASARSRCCSPAPRSRPPPPSGSRTLPLETDERTPGIPALAHTHTRTQQEKTDGEGSKNTNILCVFRWIADRKMLSKKLKLHPKRVGSQLQVKENDEDVCFSQDSGRLLISDQTGDFNLFSEHFSLQKSTSVCKITQKQQKRMCTRRKCSFSFRYVDLVLGERHDFNIIYSTKGV